MSRRSWTSSAARLDEWAERARDGERDGVHRRRSRPRSRPARSPSYGRGVQAGRAARAAVRGPRAILAKARRGTSTGGQSAGILSAMSQTVELPRVADPAADSVACGGWSSSTTTSTRSITWPRRSASRDPGRNLADGLPVRRPDPQHRLRDRLERPARGRRGLLGAARRRRADDGAARGGVGR